MTGIGVFMIRYLRMVAIWILHPVFDTYRPTSEWLDDLVHAFLNRPMSELIIVYAPVFFWTTGTLYLSTISVIVYCFPQP